MAERLVPTPAAVQAEGVPVTKMTGMMKMTGFNPKSTSDAELAELSGLLRDSGSTQRATNEEIKQVFRRLARQYHPDLNPGNKDAEEKLKTLEGLRSSI